jgi:prolyl 4-hydroxylase
MECMADYQMRYNLNMQYMEAINYVRYTPGQHFQVHADHGFSYTCTVSSVMYLNDDYEGGELWFPYLDLTFKAEAGDIVLFPSTYIFAHAAKPVISGTKYSAVTMFDYNDRNHDVKSSVQEQYAKVQSS